MSNVAFWSALFAALAVGGIAFELRRDVVPLWRLFLAPAAALACALTLPADTRWFALEAAALAVGIVAGGVRGAGTALHVDHTWKVVRLRLLRDGVAVALAMAMIVGADIAPVVAFLAGHLALAPFAAAALLCAGYLLGRAGAMAYRARKTPHRDMRPGSV